MQQTDQNIKWYQSQFESFEQGLNGQKSASVHALRRNAMHRFAELGFPTTRQEEWRFTNISQIYKTAFHPVLQYALNGISKKDIHPYVLDQAIHMVFIDGMYSPELSDGDAYPEGMIVGSLREFLQDHPETLYSYLNKGIIGEENAFTSLNTAFLWDGAYINTSEGSLPEKPIQLLFLASDHGEVHAAQPRNLIVLGSRSQCKIIETYVGLEKNIYLTNTLTEVLLGENSVLEHIKVQTESNNAYHIGTTRVSLNGGSQYTSNAITLGSSIARNNVSVRFDAESAECTLNGLSLSKETQVIDNHTFIDHALPHCNSHELYKSILDGDSKGVFNGKIFVRKDAQKTDAKQTNKTLLLSDGATMNTKPQLEIFADDVKCTHGATIGQLDDEQLFYLRSRGIDLDAARDILTSAFARDVVDRITVEPCRRLVERMIQDRLQYHHSESA